MLCKKRFLLCFTRKEETLQYPVYLKNFIQEEKFDIMMQTSREVISSDNADKNQVLQSNDKAKSDPIEKNAIKKDISQEKQDETSNLQAQDKPKKDLIQKDAIREVVHSDNADENPLKMKYDDLYGNQNPTKISIQDKVFSQQASEILNVDNLQEYHDKLNKKPEKLPQVEETYGEVNLPCVTCVDQTDKWDACQEGQSFVWYHDNQNFIQPEEDNSCCGGVITYSTEATLQCNKCFARYPVCTWKTYCEYQSSYEKIDEKDFTKTIYKNKVSEQIEQFVANMKETKKQVLEQPTIQINMVSDKKILEFKDTGKKLLNSYQNISNDEFQNKPNNKSLTGNHFFNAYYLAYSLHGQLVVSPDDIWLQICMQFAKFVNDNSEEFRYKLVSHEGQKEIVLIFDQNEKGFEDIYSDSFRWDIFCDKFAQKVKENTKQGICEALINDFSSSGTIEKCASYVNIMHTCEKFFTYKMEIAGCGITQVHFLGDENDWEKITEKINRLRIISGKDSKIHGWFDKLDYIINNFKKTFKGDSNIKFWNEIVDYRGVKVYGASGFLAGFENGVSGWLRDLFLYNNKNKYMGYGEDQWTREVKLYEFGSSEIKTPVKLVYTNGEEYQLNYLSGFTNCLEKDGIFRPQMSVGFSIASDK